MASRRLALLVALPLSLLIWFGPAREARAHASLVRAEPADGAMLAASPAALTLTFNEPVAPLVVRLIGPNGAPIVLRSVVAENATIIISGLPALASGSHVLSWRVTSADGHPVGGAVMFSIGAPSAPPAVDPEDVAGRNVRAALWAAKVALYAGLFVGIGGAFFLAWMADVRSCAAGPLIATLLAGLIAVPASVGLQGLDALDLPLTALQQKAAWEAGLASSYARTAIVAAFALFLALFSFAASSARVARGLSLVGLLGLGLALALSGHAAIGEPQVVNRPAVALHAVCVAFWIGALLPLFAQVRTSPTGDSAIARFSRAIPLVIFLLVASGLWLAVVQLGRIDALWSTSYGQVLGCKLAAVVILFALAAANRYRWVPRLAADRQGSVRTSARRALTVSIAFELVIALAILGLVGLWRFTPPPRALAAAAAISIHIHGEKAMAQIEIERAGKEPAHATILLLDGEFRPMTAKEVTLLLANPVAGIEPMRRTATARAGGWRIDDLRIPVAGRWSLRVELLISDFDKLTIEDTVALPRVP